MFKKLTIAIVALFVANAVTISSASAQGAHDQEATVASSVLKSGKFKGLNKHVTTGGVSIIKTASGYVAILEGDFSLDGAPAPTLGFGKNGFDKKSEFTKLESKTGLQVYAIPANINPADYDEFYVWCKDFSVGLGVASLK
ncbi:MAG: hypothetical protein DHS20C05_02710 [Hyphococcus sp.]|nr:MAG: hypothetical protein DHS20C05_02710 [Marinicaulis sp.]